MGWTNLQLLHQEIILYKRFTIGSFQAARFRHSFVTWVGISSHCMTSRRVSIVLQFLTLYRGDVIAVSFCQNLRYQRPFTIFRVEEIIFKHSWNDRFIPCDAKILQRRTNKNDPTTFLTKHFGVKQRTNENPRWATNAPVTNSQQTDKDKCWQW